MNIVLTGANGFIGSNLICKFKEKKCNVMNLSYREDFDININKIIDFEPTILIHCAWSGGNNYLDSNSLDQYDKNIPNSIKLLELINSIKTIKSFVGIGSSFEYGNKKDKFVETDIEQPVDFYGLTKTFFKTYSNIYCKLNNIEWTWIRPVYTYGPKDIKTRLIPRTIIKMIKNESDIKFNSCQSIVDYLYIDDFTEATYELIKQNKNGIFNICSGQEYKVKDIILKIAEITKFNKNISFDESDDIKKPNYICGDNAKIKKEILWKPKINLEEGLNKTIQKIIL